MAELSLADERLEAETPRRGQPFRSFAAGLAAENERRILWLPVFFGGGIALYFALTVEPPSWLGAAATVTGALAAVLLPRLPAWRRAVLCLTVIAAGFALISETARERAASMLDHRLGPVAVTGTVIDIDTMERGWRIIVAPDPLPGLDASSQPRRLRIHITATSDLLSPGDRASLKAMLYPVPGQTLPGAHDLQRELYFAQIGGVGYSYGGARRIAASEDVGGPGG
jgi:competence protein ComEC